MYINPKTPLSQVLKTLNFQKSYKFTHPLKKFAKKFEIQPKMKNKNNYNQKVKPTKFYIKESL